MSALEQCAEALEAMSIRHARQRADRLEAYSRLVSARLARMADHGPLERYQAQCVRIDAHEILGLRELADRCEGEAA